MGQTNNEIYLVEKVEDVKNCHLIKIKNYYVAQTIFVDDTKIL